MSSEWKTVKIEDVAEKVAMGPFGSSIKVSTFVKKGIPIISGAHLKYGRLTEDNFNFITEEHADRLKNSNVYRGDVIFTHAGNIGQVSVIPDHSKYNRYIISQRQFYLRCNRNVVLPEYIMYYFKTREGQHKLLANASQTGVPSIAQPVTYLKSIEISLPPIDEQARIVSILSTIDDKIELNNAINKNLEEMAQTLFKHWFVNFEFPNENGEPYKSSGGEFVDSELGLIPRGWEIGKVGDIARNRNYNLKPDEIPKETYYIGLEHISRKNLTLLQYGNAEGIGSSKTYFKKNDILFGKLRPYFHKVCIAPFEGVCSTDIIPIYAGNYKYYGFLAFTLFSERLIEYVTQGSTGTKMPRTNWKYISEYKIVIPPNHVAEKFTKIFDAFVDLMHIRFVENKNLTQLRDTLLPKLMSGEIRVPVEQP